MLDNFLFSGATESEYRYGLESFPTFAPTLEVYLVQIHFQRRKRRYRQQTSCFSLVSLSIRYQTKQGSQKERFQRARQFYLKYYRKIWDRSRRLKSVIGKLQFVTAVIPVGRTFLRRLHKATVGSCNPLRRVSINHEMKLDLRMCLGFLRRFKWEKATLFGEIFVSTDLCTCTAIVKKGFGSSSFHLRRVPGAVEEFGYPNLEHLTYHGLGTLVHRSNTKCSQLPSRGVAQIPERKTIFSRPPIRNRG